MSDESETRFLADVRHELSTPLNAIIGYGELISEQCREQGQKDFLPDLQKIIDLAKELVEIVKEIIDPDRIEAQSPDKKVELVDAGYDFRLRTALNPILGFAEMALESASEQGLVDLIPDLEKIHAAAGIFLALLDKYRVIQFETGVEPLYAVLSSASQVLETASGQASEFPAPPDRACGGEVLVVDDNPMNRDILERYLERLGHHVSLAYDGRQALEMIEKRRFDLVLLDIIMPEMDGYQALERLKEHPAWRDIPVIMISSLDEIDSVARCIEMGAEDYLPKPFNQVLLTARICACLDKKRLRDQEVEYLKNVLKVTSAAAAVEAGEFDPESLADVALREDGLGQLARVFQNMARVVFAREYNLKQKIQLLQIELDEARQARQAAEITETEYFQRLESKAQEYRKIMFD